MNLHGLLNCIFVLLSGFFSPTGATSFFVRPFSQFTQTAPNIIRGTVERIRVETGVTLDGGKTIYTFADTAVKETIRGSIQSRSIVIRKVGGTKEGMTLDIPGSPEFVEGEDTVLFLSEENEDQSYSVIGMEMGKFGLKEENGQTVLTGGIFNFSNPHAETEHEPGHEAEPTFSNENLDENKRAWSLDELKNLVKSMPPPSLNTTATEAHLLNTTQHKSGNFTETSPTPTLTQSEPENRDDASKNYRQHIALISWILGGIFLLVALIFYLKRRKLLP